MRQGWEPLAANTVTLTDTLRSAGRTSALIGDTPYMLAERFGCAQRFDKTHFVRGQFGDDAPDTEQERLKRFVERWSARDRSFTEESLAFARKQAADLLWIDLFDTHEPFMPRTHTADIAALKTPLPNQGLLPSAEDAVRLRVLCEAQAQETLDQVGAFISEQADAVTAGHCSICVLSDHGTPLGEALGPSGEPLWRKVVPFVGATIARTSAWIFSARCPPGVSTALHSTVDWTDTFCDLLELPRLAASEGHSLLKASRTEVYSGWYRGPMALRTQEKTYAFWPGDFSTMRSFERLNDPLELRPHKLDAEERVTVAEAMLSFVLQRLGTT
jgi:hypothetical protein